MLNRKIIHTILFLLFLVTSILGGIIYHFRHGDALEVIFLDVGQGDAILIQEGSQQLLIDGGRNGKILLEKLGKHIPFWDRQIETLVATHPDQDHIGGLIDVLKAYEVSTVIKTKAESDSVTYKLFQEKIEKEKAEVVEAVFGVRIKFSQGGEASVLYPTSSVDANSKNDNSNESSVVIELDYGKDKFLFTADLPAEKEAELVGSGADLDVDFLKVAHHGSKYSTSEEFLEKTSPKEAIISVGKNNMYGHPAPEIVERLLQRGIKIFRTDEGGDKIYSCINNDCQ